jgi:hypothetical protein
MSKEFKNYSLKNLNKNMKEEIPKNDGRFPNGALQRLDIADWYKITTRTLRYRMEKAFLRIANRNLMIDDAKLIFKVLGEPPFLPPDLRHFFY